MASPSCISKTTNGPGFTLVELSIVLVIIGLIIGGVLVGRDLITAATVRAQIAQIEKYQTAVNTFRGKYGYLPGDIPDPAVTQFGGAGRQCRQRGWEWFNRSRGCGRQSRGGRKQVVLE